MTLYNQTREVMLVHLVIFNTCIANQWQGYEVITEVKRRGGKKNWNWRWWVMEVNAPSDTKLSPEQRWGRLLFSHMEDISHRTHSHGQREMLWLIACCKRGHQEPWKEKKSITAASTRWMTSTFYVLTEAINKQEGHYISERGRGHNSKAWQVKKDGRGEG